MSGLLDHFPFLESFFWGGCGLFDIFTLLGKNNVHCMDREVYLFIPAAEDDLNIIPSNMSRDCIAQVWYRILHIIGKLSMIFFNCETRNLKGVC